MGFGPARAVMVRAVFMPEKVALKDGLSWSFVDSYGPLNQPPVALKCH